MGDLPGLKSFEKYKDFFKNTKFFQSGEKREDFSK